ETEMDRDLELNVHLLEKNEIKNTINAVNNALEKSGFSLGESSTLLLYDPEIEMDFDIEPVNGLDNLIQRISSWPLLGVVGYEYSKYIVEVSFRKHKEADSIHCISLSFPDGLYRDKQFLVRLKNIAVLLHEQLNAVRTISDVEIESETSGYSVDSEIEMLEKKLSKVNIG
ncbi:MAG: hypothetical protein AAFZ92_05175, partial [Pseudomonadota bacterium]